MTKQDTNFENINLYGFMLHMNCGVKILYTGKILKTKLCP